jgi:SAM-dependent methyltransferase
MPSSGLGVTIDTTKLEQEIWELAPWHLDVEVAPGISTAVAEKAGQDGHDPRIGRVAFQRPREGFRRKLLELYPDGLEGRSVLDCGCNCGAYLFWAKELGAGRCLGFDVREHWIRQGRFLRRHREDAADVQLEVLDLYDLPSLELDPFDVTLFNGVFYHLPDPVHGLKLVADLTKELIFVDTLVKADQPDGFLAVGSESTEQLMSGVHGLMWSPTGPDVMTRVLRWCGFPETRVTFWRKQAVRDGWGRLEIAAARAPGVLDRIGSGG